MESHADLHNQGRTGKALVVNGLNDRELGASEDVAGLESFSGDTARAVRFACPFDAVDDGYNRLHVRQVDGSSALQIVWVEIRVEPEK